MSDDPILDLLDDVLAMVEGTAASAVDVAADGFSIRLRRVADAPALASGRPREAERAASESVTVRSPAVGIFSAAKEWRLGDRIAQGEPLGDVQSLGHVAEIAAPIDGTIREVVTPSGAPVEYGQPLFALDRA